MLSPLLKTTANQTQPALPGEHQALHKSRNEQDFNQIFNQQREQPVRERSDSGNGSQVKKDVKSPTQSSGQSAERADADAPSDSATVSNLHLKDQSGQPVDAVEHEDAEVDIQNVSQYTDELKIDANTLEQNSSWLFWLHYAQDASVVEKPLEVSTLQQPNVPVGLAKNEPQTLALAPLASMPFEASVADAEQPMGTIAAELAPIAANTKELNAPISALNKTNENKALNDVVNGFTSPVDSTEDVGFTSLLAERVPNVLVKPQADVAVQSRELPLLGEASVDSARIPAHQTVVQENQWLGQAQQPGHAVASTALDNKSFLQLRFNQQTLATDLVEKTGWLIEHKVDTAQIQLDPPELGPIAVKIHTHQEQVSVSFVVANPQVRDAMDQTLQRLKDLLQEQGINLSHADVNDQRQQRDNSGEDAPSQSSHGESTDEEIIGIHLPQDELGVDHFV